MKYKYLQIASQPSTQGLQFHYMTNDYPPITEVSLVPSIHLELHSLIPCAAQSLIKRFICSSAVSATNNCPVQRFRCAVSCCSKAMDFHQVKEWQNYYLFLWDGVTVGVISVLAVTLATEWIYVCKKLQEQSHHRGPVRRSYFNWWSTSYCEEAFKGSAFICRTMVIRHNHHLSTVYIPKYFASIYISQITTK